MARTPRDQTTREATRRGTSWKPADLLPSPDPQSGVKYRWIRTGSYGNPDTRNVSKRFREGWVPVNIKDHPELQVMVDQNSRFQDGVEIGGLLLCKNSEENVDKRNEYYDTLARQQMESVDNNLLREQDPRMPTLKKESRTRITFGSGGQE